MENNRDASNEVNNPVDALGRKNVTTQKHTGKFYPCAMCGKEECEASRAGYIPKYCKSCLKLFRKENIAKTTLNREEAKIFKAEIVISMPDGSIAYLRNEEEKTYVQHRLDIYQKEFDWTASADMGLLTKLVLLELQTNRLAKLLTIKYKGVDAKVLSILTEEYRKCQADLGINRTRRVSENSTADAHSIMKELIDKFKSYKEKHPDRFMWKCKHCGQISGLDKQNPEVPVIEEVLIPEDAAPESVEVKAEENMKAGTPQDAPAVQSPSSA